MRRLLVVWYGPYLFGGGFFSESDRYVKSDRSGKLEKCVIAGC
jgi:hypothetical protein